MTDTTQNHMTPPLEHRDYVEERITDQMAVEYPLQVVYGLSSLRFVAGMHDFMRGTADAVLRVIPGMGYLRHRGYIRDTLVYTRYRNYSADLL